MHRNDEVNQEESGQIFSPLHLSLPFSDKVIPLCPDVKFGAFVPLLERSDCIQCIVEIVYLLRDHSLTDCCA